MQPVNFAARRYDGVTIAFHRLTAVLVVEQWLGAQVIDYFPRGSLRVDARSVHITLGAFLAILLVARIFWRGTSGRRLAPADAGWLNVMAKATHWCLYALLTGMVVLGLFLTWTRGDSLFNLISIPAYAPGDEALPDQVQELHAIVGYLILAVAGLHAAAALVHRLVWHDGILGRMLPAQQRRRV
jgi:cytochrome b561